MPAELQAPFKAHMDQTNASPLDQRQGQGRIRSGKEDGRRALRAAQRGDTGDGVGGRNTNPLEFILRKIFPNKTLQPKTTSPIFFCNRWSYDWIGERYEGRKF